MTCRITNDPYWDRLREQLGALTLRELKALAKAEGVCLGYSASRKDSCVGSIVSHFRHLAVERMVDGLDDGTLGRRTELRMAYCDELRPYEEPHEPWDEARQRSAVIEECAAPGVEWHPITDGGEEVGFLVLGHGWIYCHPMCDLHVCQTYVAPGHRGRGLMGEALSRLVGAPGVRTVSLGVLKANEPAKGFWRHVLGGLGFEAAPDIPCMGDMGGDMEEWHYRRGEAAS